MISAGWTSSLLVRDGRQLVIGNRFKGGIMPGTLPPLHRYHGNLVLSVIGCVW